jgi:hypothetical protein
VALILRYDVQRNFRSKYFRTAFLGYVAGLATTIVVMNVFQVGMQEAHGRRTGRQTRTRPATRQLPC